MTTTGATCKAHGGACDLVCKTCAQLLCRRCLIDHPKHMLADMQACMEELKTNLPMILKTKAEQVEAAKTIIKQQEAIVARLSKDIEELKTTTSLVPVQIPIALALSATQTGPYKICFSNGSTCVCQTGGTTWRSWKTAELDRDFRADFGITACDSSNHIMIGIFKSFPEAPGFNNTYWDIIGGYGYYGNNGCKYSSLGHPSYGETFRMGDKIGIIFADGSLRFEKNGVSQGVAYQHIQLPVSIAVGVYSTGTVVELLHITYLS